MNITTQQGQAFQQVLASVLPQCLPKVPQTKYQNIDSALTLNEEVMTAYNINAHEAQTLINRDLWTPLFRESRKAA